MTIIVILLIQCEMWDNFGRSHKIRCAKIPLNMHLFMTDSCWKEQFPLVELREFRKLLLIMSALLDVANKQQFHSR